MNLDFDVLDYIVRALGLLRPADRRRLGSCSCETPGLVSGLIHPSLTSLAQLYSRGLVHVDDNPLQTVEPGHDLVTPPSYNLREYCEAYGILDPFLYGMETDVAADKEKELDRARHCAVSK